MYCTGVFFYSQSDHYSTFSPKSIQVLSTINVIGMRPRKLGTKDQGLEEN